jgi:hypothetical protein
MRATQRTAFLSLRHLGAALAVTGLASVAACADALHLDPPGAGGSTTTTKTTASTGGGATCHSNPDCAYPTPVCDTVSSHCFECLVLADCTGKPGTVCSLGRCECPSPDGAALTYCAGQAPTCVDTQTSPTNCGQCGLPCAGPCVGGFCSTATTTGTGGAGTGGSGTGGSAADAGDDSG